jgi:predicted nucleic acid-binding OB-fold protein
MKTILTTAILLFALSYGSSAQQAQQRNLRQELTPEELAQMQVNMAQRQTQQMKERLKLDEEQEKAINEINLRYAVLRAQITELARTEQDLDIPALMTELEQKQENEILPFLNEDQMEPYYALKKEQQERRQQMQQRQGGQQGGQRGEGQRQGGGGQQRRQQ